MMAYFVTTVLVDGVDMVNGLYCDDAGHPSIPLGAIQISDSDGDILRRGFSGYAIAGGAAIKIQSFGLNVAKFDAIRRIELARDTACTANVTALGHVWQADRRSQELLGQAITLAQAGLPLPAVWRDFNNSDMPIAALADLLAIAGAIAAQTQAAYSASWARKAAVAAALTVAEVEAIAW